MLEDNQQIKKENSVLSEQIASFTLACRVVVQANSELKEEYRLSQERNQNMEERLAMMQVQIGEFQQEHKELNTTIARLTKEKVELEGEKDLLIQIASEPSAREARQKEKKLLLKERVQNLTNAKEAQKRVIEDLQRKIEHLKKDKQLLKADNQIKDASIQKLGEEKADLEEGMATLTKQHDKLSQDKGVLEQEIQKVNAEKSVLEKENDEIVDAAAIILNKLKRINAENDVLKTDNQDLKSELKNEKELKAKLEQQLSKINQDFTLLQTKQDKIKAKFKELVNFQDTNEFRDWLVSMINVLDIFFN